MELHITFTKQQPKYLAIYEQIKEKIVQKQLKVAEKLPSKRQLATYLHVSVQTVQFAYDQLLSEGYIYSKERSGYFIGHYEFEWQPVRQPQQPLKLQQSNNDTFFNLKNGQVDSETFPYTTWLKLYRKQLQNYSLSNADWQGEFSLRNEIARYVTQARGIHCSPAQIFIYSGTQQQLQSLCTFLKPTTAAIEEPGFLRATTIFQQNNTQLQFVPIDEMGATIPSQPSNVYYVTPAHQYPLGFVMPLERKSQLLLWANNIDCYIIEDDYDAEFRYLGIPIPPLAQIDQFQKVIYFGTFSKTLMPALRISYMILPIHLLGDYQIFYHNQKSTVSKTDQLVLAEFMSTGNYAKHIAKMRTLYRKKHKALLAALKINLNEEFTILGDSAGLHVIVQLPEWLQEKEAIQLAFENKILLDPVSVYYQQIKPEQYVMLGFGAIPLDDIHTAVQRLAQCWLER